jgi:hypothetical protein
MYLSEAVKLYAVKSVITQNQFLTKVTLLEHLFGSGNRVSINFLLINELHNMVMIRKNRHCIFPCKQLTKKYFHMNMVICNPYLTLSIFPFLVYRICMAWVERIIEVITLCSLGPDTLMKQN